MTSFRGIPLPQVLAMMGLLIFGAGWADGQRDNDQTGSVTAMTRKVGQPCRSGQCRPLKSECRDGYCQCLIGYKVKNANKRRCVLKTLGDTCSLDSDDCGQAVSNSECVLGSSTGSDDNTVTDNPSLVNSTNESDLGGSISSALNLSLGVCSCGDGFVAAGEKTCRNVRIGDVCTESSQCSRWTEFSECRNSTCRCLRSYKRDGWNGTTASCVLRLIGDGCKSRDQCGLTNSRCGRSYRCECDRGFIPTEKKDGCVLPRLRTTECKSQRECSRMFNNSRCEISRGVPTCHCNKGLIESRDRRTCYFVVVNSSCVSNTECLTSVNNTECRDNVCACVRGFTPSDDFRSCDKSRLGVNMKCETDRTCLSLTRNSFCDNKFHTNSGTMTTSINSTLSKTNTTPPGLCKCVQGYKTNGELDRCVPIALGDLCESDTDCQTVSGISVVCAPRSKTCACAAGYVLTADRAVCLPRQLGKQTCLLDFDCETDIPNSYCPVCQGETTTNTPSTQGRHLHGNCETCQCKEGFVKANDTACQRLRLLDGCHDDNECQSAINGSVCRRTAKGARCWCSEEFRNAGDGCRPVTVNDACASNEQCGDQSTSHMECVRRTCTCKKGYVVNTDDGTCVQLLIGDKCPENNDCSGVPHASCDLFLRRCVCRLGYIPGLNDTSCVPRVLGDRCSRTVECNQTVRDGVCDNLVCACPPGYRSTDDRSCLKRTIGDPCAWGHECRAAMTGSHCHQGLCACSPGSYFSRANHSCKTRVLKDLCTKPTDCSHAMQHSTCGNGTCVCEPGFEPHLDKTNTSTICTFKPKTIGDPCLSSSQCQKIDSRSVCAKVCSGSANNTVCPSMCTCPHDTFTSRERDECVPLPKKLTDRCNQDKHCSDVEDLTSSHCVDQQCQCLDGHFPGADQNRCHPYPSKHGHYCENSTHCETSLKHMHCGEDNKCVCIYSHEEVYGVCRERARIPPQKTVRFEKAVACEQTCENWTNAVCDSNPGEEVKACQCKPRYGRAFRSHKCIPIQAYKLVLAVVEQADVYDYKPIVYANKFESQDRLGFRRMARRIEQNGLEELFMRDINLKHRYVNSRVTRIEPLTASREGLLVTVLLFIKARYMNATNEKDILAAFTRSFARVKRDHSQPPEEPVELGESRLRVSTNSSQPGVVVRDFNECASPQTNDCSENGFCINTLGSYVCACKPRYEDTSNAEGLEAGRKCVPLREVILDEDACSINDEDCSTEFVALALTLFLVILFAFIIYEIIQRKQMFTAQYRKLYEKLGTTKIRRLRRASMAKIHDVRKLQQELRAKHGRKKKGWKKKKKNKGQEDDPLDIPDDIPEVDEENDNAGADVEAGNGGGGEADGAGVTSSKSSMRRKSTKKKEKKKLSKKEKNNKKKSTNDEDVTFSEEATSPPLAMAEEEDEELDEQPSPLGVNIVHPPAMPDQGMY